MLQRFQRKHPFPLEFESALDMLYQTPEVSQDTPVSSTSLLRASTTNKSRKRQISANITTHFLSSCSQQQLHIKNYREGLGEGSGTPTPALLPGKSHGWRSLVGCCLWGRTESDTTEATQQQRRSYCLLLFVIENIQEIVWLCWFVLLQ